MPAVSAPPRRQTPASPVTAAGQSLACEQQQLPCGLLQQRERRRLVVPSGKAPPCGAPPNGSPPTSSGCGRSSSKCAPPAPQEDSAGSIASAAGKRCRWSLTVRSSTTRFPTARAAPLAANRCLRTRSRRAAPPRTARRRARAHRSSRGRLGRGPPPRRRSVGHGAWPSRGRE